MISFASVSVLLVRLASKLSLDSATRELAEAHLHARGTNTYLHLLVTESSTSLSLKIFRDSGATEQPTGATALSWRT